MNKQPAMILREGIKVLFVHAPRLVMYKWLHETDMSSYFSLFHENKNNRVQPLNTDTNN